MLRIISNVNDCNRGYKDLSAIIESTGETIGDKITITVNNHGLLTNDILLFRREDGETISFEQEVNVEEIIDKNTFTINGFNDYLLLPNGYEIISLHNPKSKTHTVTKYIKLTLSESNRHILTTNKDDISISGTYNFDETINDYFYNGKRVLCDGDYVLFDEVFLLKWENDEFSNILNIKNFNFKAIYGHETVFNLKNCIVGVNIYGNDDRLSIYIPFTGNTSFANHIDEYYSDTIFFCDDIRFLHDSTNIMNFGTSFQNGASLYKETGDIEVDFGAGFDFALNMYQDELFSNYASSIAEGEINDIIDYEKHQYHPMYYSGDIKNTEDLDGGQKKEVTADEFLLDNLATIDDYLKPIRKIVFNLNFRQKNYKENDDGTIDYGSWSTDDSKFWNNYELVSSGDRLTKVNKNINADLLGFLGFTDDDVYYQKDALKKSFLRLSFYDSPNRETQKLLFYSTVFFDTNVLSSNYLRDITAINECADEDFELNKNQIVYSTNFLSLGVKNTNPICAEMFCTDKYDDTSSSDGFYVHLYDKMVSGNTFNTIYMKAEFNNAKFGKTVPMIMPTNQKTNRPIDAESTTFPRDYFRKCGNNGLAIDVNKLMKDMYIKVFIKYDFKLGKYVWFLPVKGYNDTLTFNLFEPRINGYDTMSYYLINDGSIGYGTEDGVPTWFDASSGSFSYDGLGGLVWYDEDGNSEEYSISTQNCTCLYTTAITNDTQELIDGTKLFNEGGRKLISSIWIDGIKVSDSMFDDGVLKTNKLQLTDESFYVIVDGVKTKWNPKATKETWDETNEEFVVDESKNPQIIHSVNYYFKDNKSDSTTLLNELYLGINGNVKTIETSSDIVNKIKSNIPSDNLLSGQLLPIGMFSNIESLKCVKFYEKNSGYRFTTVGNSAFNNCKNLIKVDMDDDNSPYIIGKNCFSGCKGLKLVNIGNVVAILRQAFQGDYTLTKLIFNCETNANTRYIGCGSFGYTKVNHITLPGTILRIGNSAFRKCYKLNDIMFDDEKTGMQLMNIGKRVFYDNAIMRYMLSKTIINKYGKNKVRYTYNNQINYLISYLSYEHYNSVFYNKENEVSKSINYNRSNIIQDSLETKYAEYLKENIKEVLSDFEHWYKFIYEK